jgi:DnaK suppressor protein
VSLSGTAGDDEESIQRVYISFDYRPTPDSSILVKGASAISSVDATASTDITFACLSGGPNSNTMQISRWALRTMSRSVLNKYTKMLQAKQAELSLGLRNREEIAIEKTPDAIDEGLFAGERELAISNLDRESALLRDVQDALSRMADGSYGTCLHCDEKIKSKRLDAVPWARYCVECQETADRHRSVLEPTIP